jgi:hypothetical protein
MPSKITKAIKGQDIFGHKISFNFNEEGETHRTLIGGLVSLLLKLLLSLFVVFRFKRLMLYEDNKTSSLKSVSSDDITVNFNETFLVPFFVLSKQS